jgi:copper transport protein
MGRSAVILVLVLGGALALPQALAAHSLLQSSDPAAGSTVASTPPIITLTFGEVPDPKLSSVKVLDASGRSVAPGGAEAVPGRQDQLQVRLDALADGVYTVAWRTVSAVDGHAAAGSFAFGIGVTPAATATAPGAGATTSSSGSPASAFARFLLYLGLVGMFGAGFVGATIHPRPPRSVVRLAAAGWLLSMLGAVGVVVIQFSDTGADLGTFGGSALGIWVASRLIVAIGSGIVVLVLLAWPGVIETWLFGLVAINAAVGMLIDVVSGHAAADGLVTLQVVAQFVHILAAGLWMGGLAALLLSIRGAASDEKAIAARRFSTWAGIGLAAIAVTGLIRAIQEIGTIDALVSTDFGRLVIAKTALLGVLGCLGAINHFISVPEAIRSLSRLRRVGRVEVGLGLVVLVVTGILVNLAPPTSVAAAPVPAAAPPLIATGSDFGTSVRVRLVVSPGLAGLNQFSVAVSDYDTGAPAPASTVTLRFSSATASLGDSSLALAPAAAGSFAGSGGNLSLDGIWKVTAVVATTSGAVEVPLPVATRIPDLHVEANPVAGAPTIFTAHLPSGDSLQTYLDPGGQGHNELHATFFDASGSELPVPSATYLVVQPNAPGSIITPRQLEPGHFVADLQVAGDTVGIDVVGRAPDGSTLHARFDVPVQP